MLGLAHFCQCVQVRVTPGMPQEVCQFKQTVHDQTNSLIQSQTKQHVTYNSIDFQRGSIILVLINHQLPFKNKFVGKGGILEGDIYRSDFCLLPFMQFKNMSIKRLPQSMASPFLIPCMGYEHCSSTRRHFYWLINLSGNNVLPDKYASALVGIAPLQAVPWQN